MPKRNEKLEGFKACRISDGRLFSLIHKTGTLEYIPGKKTVPFPGWGPLAVFINFRACSRFISNLYFQAPNTISLDEEFSIGRGYGVIIKPCQYIPNDEHRLWDRYQDELPMICCPYGTAFASAVFI